MIKKSLTVILGIAGFGLAALAIFANWFGLDLENNWGRGRVIVAETSLLIIIIFFCIISRRSWAAFIGKIKRIAEYLVTGMLQWYLLKRLRQLLSSRLGSWKAKWGCNPVFRWYKTRLRAPIVDGYAIVRNSRPVRFFANSQDRMSVLVAGILGVGVVIIYIWYISLGLWTEWPTTSTYYYTLADAFWHRQTNLLLEPHPTLLALSDPYQVENRQGFPYLWDAVLFNGKYFLYWGPAPALILTAIRLFYSGEIGDHILAFGFIFGGFVVNILLLLKIRKRFFQNLGWPYIVPGILMAGLANPTLWMLDRAKVYEAAIAGGQFFLMAGFYLAILWMDAQRRNYWRLAFVGFILALAMASRMSIAPAAFFLFFMVAWNIFQEPELTWNKKVFSIGVLSIPFTSGLLGLGWYNKVRFGSWFEFGQRYQLTTMNQNALYNHIFSWANIPINSYNYLFNPFGICRTFPYFNGYWTTHFVFFPVNSPKYYSISEPVSGLILVVPYLLFALIAIFFLAWEGGKALRKSLQKRTDSPNMPENQLLHWILFTLSGMSVLAFAPILFFFVATMRYLGDVVAWLVLLATLGSWIGVKCLANKPDHKRWFWVLVFFVMVASAAVSSLLAISGVEWRMEKINPELFYRLVDLFSFGK
jgi:hypothetical protein